MVDSANNLDLGDDLGDNDAVGWVRRPDASGGKSPGLVPVGRRVHYIPLFLFDSCARKPLERNCQFSALHLTHRTYSEKSLRSRLVVSVLSLSLLVVSQQSPLASRVVSNSWGPDWAVTRWLIADGVAAGLRRQAPVNPRLAYGHWKTPCSCYTYKVESYSGPL